MKEEFINAKTFGSMKITEAVTCNFGGGGGTPPPPPPAPRRTSAAAKPQYGASSRRSGRASTILTDPFANTVESAKKTLLGS